RGLVMRLGLRLVGPVLTWLGRLVVLHRRRGHLLALLLGGLALDRAVGGVVLAVLLHLLDLALEDARRASEAASGVRKPLPAEDQDEQDDDDEDLLAAKTTHGIHPF